jgi:hypothetical protein
VLRAFENCKKFYLSQNIKEVKCVNEGSRESFSIFFPYIYMVITANDWKF